jgi:hypothetical protein
MSQVSRQAVWIEAGRSSIAQALAWRGVADVVGLCPRLGYSGTARGAWHRPGGAGRAQRRSGVVLALGGRDARTGHSLRPQLRQMERNHSPESCRMTGTVA